MKKLLLIITFLLTTAVGFSQAGDICFLHTATAANITIASTYIDHPALNNNPDAIILITHNMNSDGAYAENDKVTGVFYSNSVNKWAVYNEDLSDMQVGMSFNIYVKGTQGKATIVTKPAASSFYFHVDDPIINGNSAAHPIITNNWTPNNVVNNNNYGWDYVDPEWRIYNEVQANNIPDNASFNILLRPAFLSHRPNLAYTHQATAGTIYYTNATELDNPLLNNHPEAYFVVTHSYNAPGTSGSDMDVEKNLATFYNSSTGKWHIAYEDASNFQVGSAFNVVIGCPAPENDEAADAIGIGVEPIGSGCTSPITISNIGATDSSANNGTPACGQYMGGDVWYYFNAPASGAVKINRLEQDWGHLCWGIYETPASTSAIACGYIAIGATESNLIEGLTPGTNYWLRLWEYNNNDFGIDGVCIKTALPSGIAEAQIDGLSIYPNPVKDVLNIKTSNTVDAVSIYNMMGQEVINTSKTQIDTSTLPSGAYIVKIQAGTQIGSYSLIKQ